MLFGETQPSGTAIKHTFNEKCVSPFPLFLYTKLLNYQAIASSLQQQQGCVTCVSMEQQCGFT